MDIAGEVLDKAVTDRNGHPLGRVDGISLELREGAPPRLQGLIVGPSILGSRLSPLLGRWVAVREYALGVSTGRPVCIPFDEFTMSRNQLKAELLGGESPAASVERLAREWIGRLPWAR